MANSKHLARLKQGVEVWNRWREKFNAVFLDLYGADLQRRDLVRANLSWTQLAEADLSRAKLIQADLRGADLWGAKLVNTDLRGADLTQSRFRGADVLGAVLGGTTFADVDLSDVKGLETTLHVGPSTIGIDTIYRSQGKIPEIFLRGAGVPDTFIAYIGSLVGKPIEYYSCFISYSTKDQEFAERLYADLQVTGVRCWFAPHDMAAGKKVHEQIDEAIRLHERLLLIVSPASIHSDWVKVEIMKACNRQEREQRRVLFPVRLVDFESLDNWKCIDPNNGKDLAPEVREYFIPDFSQWKDHDSYQTAFQRLLRDLKSESA